MSFIAENIATRSHVQYIVKALILCILTCSISDSELSAQSYTYNYLYLPVSSRASALGGSNAAISDRDVTMSMINPALLSGQTHMVASLDFAYYTGMSMFGTLAYGHNYKDHYFAGGLQFVDHGKFQYADIYGNRDGSTFSAKDFALTLSYAHPFTDWFTLGASLKPLYSVYERYTSFALAADLGVHFQIPDSSFQAGLVIRNMGVQLKSFYKYEGNSKQELVPFNIELAMAYRFKHAPIRLSLTLHDLQAWQINYVKNIDQTTTVLGMTSTSSNEVKWYDNMFRHTIFSIEVIPKSERFYIALSYNHQRRQEMALQNKRALSGFAIGAGVRIKQFHIGFALSQYQAGSFAYQVNLQSSIGDFLK